MLFFPLKPIIHLAVIDLPSTPTPEIRHHQGFFNNHFFPPSEAKCENREGLKNEACNFSLPVREAGGSWRCALVRKVKQNSLCGWAQSLPTELF